MMTIIGPQALSFSKNLIFRFTFGGCMLALVLALSSGVPGWFDGLPWVGRLETLAVILVTPFLMALGWKFLSFRWSIFFLLTLLVLKIFLFVGAPAGGWIVKIKPNISIDLIHPEDGGFCTYLHMELPKICDRHHFIGGFKWFGKEWTETYATFWNKEASGILKEPWTEKHDFPLDWAIPIKAKNFDALNPTIEIDGVLLLPKTIKFAVVAEGLKEGSLLATNENGESYILSPAKNFEEAAQQEFQLPKGSRWQLSGNFRYAGDDWSLVPVIVRDDGSVSSSLGRDLLWQNKIVLSLTSWEIQLYKYLSWIMDSGICVYFLIWGFWVVRFQIKEQFLTLPLALFSILAVTFTIVLAPFVTYALELVHMSDATNVSQLGISIILVAMGYLFWSFIRKDYRSFHPDKMGRFIFILFGPALLIFFANKWWSEIGQWWQWVPGDDWTTYQFFARRIVVGGEWLTGGQSALLGKELYPYVTALSHGLFGQSSFSQRMLDVWSVLCASIILAKMALKLKLTPFTAFITSTAFLMIYLIGSFRYHIGKGLCETTAMIFMMLAAWFLYEAREGGAIRIAIAIFFGVLGYWTRQDHLGVIAALAILIIEPIEGPTGGWKGYWERFKIRRQRLAYYWGGGLYLGIGLLCLRNWFIGAGVRFTGTSPNLGHNDFITPLKGIYLVLTGYLWPQFPSIAGMVMTLGTFIGFLALVWSCKPLLDFPVAIGIAILGLLTPYLFVKIWAYPPRFSIHLLPLALFSVMIFVDYFIKDNKFVVEFNAKN